MKYSESKKGTTHAVETLADGVNYNVKEPTSDTVKFIRYEDIGNDVYKLETNSNQWVTSYNYKYFVVIALAYGLFSLFIDKKIGIVTLMFLFVAFIFWSLTYFGRGKIVRLACSSYDYITLFDSEKATEVLTEIKASRDLFLKNKYLNKDGSLKDIYQSEKTIRDMSLYGIIDYNLVSKVEAHNTEYHRKERQKSIELAEKENKEKAVSK